MSPRGKSYEPPEGFIWWDKEVCKLGECAHFVATKENRHCLPYGRINLNAVWISDDAMEGVNVDELFDF